jgi:sterol desaturase/sphingolipid hydroxylase (fatty acid hydroxylase superfamily)
MGFLAAAISQTAWAVTKFGGMWVVLIALELAWPRDRVSASSRLRAFAYWAAYIVIAAFVTVLSSQAWRSLGIDPLLSPRIDTGLGLLDLLLAVLVGNLIIDLGFYWRHRIEHWFLWRFHAVHHSIRELSAVSSYHHASEDVFRVFLAFVPMSLLFDLQEALIVGMVSTFVGFWVHANTRIKLGSLRYLIIEPAFHRIHHSTNPAHFGKNFGGFTPLWDVVFRTAYFPKANEWPATGLADFPEPDGIRDYLLAPWSQLRSKAPNLDLAPNVE